MATLVCKTEFVSPWLPLILCKVAGRLVHLDSVNVCYLDSKKYFKTINSRHLPTNLTAANSGGNVINWICYYHTDYSLYVGVNGLRSWKTKACSEHPAAR